MNKFELSKTLAMSQFKLGNEGSYLGMLWYLINPLAAFTVLFIVFSNNLGSEIENYSVYLLLGIILFNLFRQITVESTRTIYNNRHLIKAMPFDYRVLILATVIRVLFSHLFEVLIFFIIASFFNISTFAIIFYPVLLFVFIVFIYGVSLFLSAISIYFMDLGNIWNAFAQALWFATPIFYIVNNNSLHQIFNDMNPLYHVITIARDLILRGELSESFSFIVLLLYATLALIVGEYTFKKASPYFAEKF